MLSSVSYEAKGEDYLMPESFIERKFIFAVSSFTNSVDIIIRMIYPDLSANSEREVSRYYSSQLVYF